MQQSMEFENTLALSSTQLSEIIDINRNYPDLISKEYFASAVAQDLLASPFSLLIKTKAQVDEFFSPPCPGTLPPAQYPDIWLN